MKNVLLILFMFLQYNPSIQRTTHLQYFKPAEDHLFSGDGMPYFHDGTFYLYWLLDEGHHAGLEGLGGHQWALSTSKDLIHWEHYPVALGIDEEWEKSICTGSVIAEKDTFYAFYATRVKEDGKVHEQLSYAISTDGGRTYKKQQPNPFYYAPEECVSRDFRDPKVFKDKDVFHLFISGYLKEPALKGYGGYLVHLVSKDLKNWEEVASPLKGQRGTPECSDYFKWNDWYYLLYSVGGNTSYLKSKHPYGPWEYPASQALSEYWSVVFKTAEFTNNRRIGVAYTPYRKDSKNKGERIWGGNVMFRELCQLEDGTLGTHFLEEVLPASTIVKRPSVQTNEIAMNASGDVAMHTISDMPEHYRMTMEVVPDGNYEELGLFIRTQESKGSKDSGYKLELNPNRKSLLLQNTTIEAVEGMQMPFTIDLMVYGEFIDVCINNQRSVLNRMPEYEGRNLLLYVKNGKATFRNIQIREIEQP